MDVLVVQADTTNASGRPVLYNAKEIDSGALRDKSHVIVGGDAKTRSKDRQSETFLSAARAMILSRAWRK